MKDFNERRISSTKDDFSSMKDNFSSMKDNFSSTKDLIPIGVYERLDDLMKDSLKEDFKNLKRLLFFFNERLRCQGKTHF
jgi:hypothetical protein